MIKVRLGIIKQFFRRKSPKIVIVTSTPGPAAKLLIDGPRLPNFPHEGENLEMKTANTKKSKSSRDSFKN
jgi:hypothetical protein